MRHLAGITLDASVFEVLKGVCRRDPAFPTNWTEMALLIDRANLTALEDGEAPAALPLDPAAFEAWCHQVGVVPGLDALKAYAQSARGTVMEILRAASGSADAPR